MNRRDTLKAVVGAAFAGYGLARGSELASAQQKLANIEASSGGRLGVHILDVRSGPIPGYRDDERFALCSTFKLPLAGIILRESDAGRLELDQQIGFSEEDMVPYAPVTERNLERGYMTVTELAAAAQMTSDNVAANLLLGLIGGPEGFTSRVRELGDEVTRLDRLEPELNLVAAGEVRDTTTPEAMAELVNVLVFGSALSYTSRAKLRTWLEATTTGRRRLKAGFPNDWRVGNKTGTGIAPGMANKYNDVAVAWRPGSEGALIVAAYFEADGEYPRIRLEDEDVLRQVAELASCAGT